PGAVFHAAVAEYRLERALLLPKLRIEGLTIVVRVPQDGSRCAWNPQFSIDQWIYISLEDLHGEPAPVEHLAQVFGVLPDIRFVGSDIRNRQQGDELRQNFRPVFAHVSFDRRAS